MIASAAADSTPQALLVIAKWCECLESRSSFGPRLPQLAELMGARWVSVSRYSRRAPHGREANTSGSPYIVASSDKIDASYAFSVLRNYLERPKVGSVWLSSSTMDHLDGKLATFQSSRGIADTAVIPLDVAEGKADFLELHFEDRRSRTEVNLLENLGSGMARIWSTRCSVVFDEEGQDAVRNLSGTHVLAHSNPFGLTKTEYRICYLLRQGVHLDSLRDELGISLSTLRTHMRSIYRKTKVATGSELAFRVMAPLSLKDSELN